MARHRGRVPSGGRGISAVVILAAVAAAAGCAAPPASPAQQPQGEPTPSFFGPHNVPEQIRAARERFPERLPDGIYWATDPYAPDPTDEDAVYEDGVFDVAASEYWLCAWMDDYVSAVDGGDSQRADSAMTELEKYVSLPAIAAHHQNPDDFVTSVLEPARLGDATMLREFFATCTSYQRATAS